MQVFQVVTGPHGHASTPLSSVKQLPIKHETSVRLWYFCPSASITAEQSQEPSEHKAHHSITVAKRGPVLSLWSSETTFYLKQILGKKQNFWEYLLKLLFHEVDTLWYKHNSTRFGQSAPSPTLLPNKKTKFMPGSDTINSINYQKWQTRLTEHTWCDLATPLYNLIYKSVSALQLPPTQSLNTSLIGSTNSKLN